MRAFAQLHRSIVFWAGLLVVLFLAWAWVDSRHREYVAYHTFSPEHGISIASKQMGIRIEDQRIRNPADRSSYSHFEGSGFRAKPVTKVEGPWFPAAGIKRHFDPHSEVAEELGFGKHTDRYVLPYWLIIALVLATWLPLALWRARKIASIRDAVAPPDAR